MATKTLMKPEPTTIQEAGERPLLDQALERTALSLDTTARRYTQALAEAQGQPFRRAILLAEGIDALRQSITPALTKVIMSLMNSPLGFGSDRGPGRGKGGTDIPPYDEKTVKDAFVQSLLLDFYPVGAEWMIYKGRFFGCIAGWKRKLEGVPGISDIKIAAGIPLLHNGRQVVRVKLSWRLNGVPDELVGPDGKPGIGFAPTAFGGESADQLIGKAKARAYRAAFEQATGSKTTVEDDMEPVEEAPSLPAGSSGNGDGPKRVSDAQLAPYREEVRALACELEMDDTAVRELAAEIGADMDTIGGLVAVRDELKQKLRETRTGMEGD